MDVLAFVEEHKKQEDAKRKKKLPKASSSRSSSLRNKVREEYPGRIVEGLSTPVESGVGLVAPFAVVIEAQFLDKVSDVPVVLLRQVYMVQTVQKTVEFPQQFLDKVVVLPVMVQDRGFRPDSAETRAVL